MSGGKKRKHARSKLPPVQAVSREEMAAILERTRAVLSPEEHAKLTGAIDTLAQVTAQLQAKDASLERLRRMLFGASTETSRNVLGDNTQARDPSHRSDTTPREKAPGHGRNAASAYTGAQRVSVPHPQLQAAQSCPGCTSGKLYPQGEPSQLVRITGMAPLRATVYACERLRCNLCGEVYTAPAPEGVGAEKYDATATGMVALLKYGTGLPFQRIETLQAGMGIPMPAATQWDLVSAGAKDITCAHEELINQAAQSRVVYNDDTTMKVLQLTKAQRAAALADDVKCERTGVFTSGIVATDDGHKIALFFTAVRHAGENLNAVLARRRADLPPPIQMADGLSRNVPSDFDTILGSCLARMRAANTLSWWKAFPNRFASCWKPCARCTSPMRELAKRASIRNSDCYCIKKKVNRGWKRSSNGCTGSSPSASSSPTHPLALPSSTCKRDGLSSRCSCAYPAHLWTATSWREP